MHIAFLNPQGNFDPKDSYWTVHPDFGGQLVYVKEVSTALSEQGHKVDIFTRRIKDKKWPEFAAEIDHYPGFPNVRIVRIPFGGDGFLPKEKLWPRLGTEFVNGIIAFYEKEGGFPDVFTGHYADGGLTGVVMQQKKGAPFTFTGHSLGANKMDKLNADEGNIAQLNEQYNFARRIYAERLSMSNSSVNIVSTANEWYEQYAHHAYRGSVDINDDSQFKVIPPGVNLRIFGHDVRDEREDEIAAYVDKMLKRDIDADRIDLPVIIASSRFEQKKNHIGLVKAFAHSEEFQKKANIAIIARGMENPLKDHDILKANEGKILDDIVKIINEHNLWGKVSSFSLSGQTELAATYRHLAQRRSVFALLSHYEPFGLAQLEAMAAGMPSVATKNGGPSESMYDSEKKIEYGVLVDPADPADIARGALKLLADWDYYQKAGIMRIHDKYSWASTAKAYAGVISEVKQGVRKPARLMEIPEYFTNPTEENDISLKWLKEMYLEEKAEV